LDDGKGEAKGEFPARSRRVLRGKSVTEGAKTERETGDSKSLMQISSMSKKTGDWAG